MPAAVTEASYVFVPLTFLWVSFIIELTPGPNMTYLAVLSLVLVAFWLLWSTAEPRTHINHVR